MKAAVQRFAAALSAAFLVSCGGGSDGGTAAQLDGAIVKGPVTGSSVCAYRLLGGVKGEKLNLQATSPGGVIANGCFVTGADGGYAFTVPGYTGEVLLEASGGTFCSDETQVSGGACGAGGVPVALTETMTAAASVQNGSRSTTYVTPLSTAAVEDAKANGGVTVETFRSRFATLAGTVLGPNSTVTPATAPTPTTHTYLANAAKQMQGGTTLKSIVSGLQSGNGGTTGSGGKTPATINSALVGAYDLVFKVGGGDGCGSVCSYQDGESVRVEVHTDGRLVIGTMELTSPFHRTFSGSPHLPEIIWLDATHNIEYALSDNADGHFNEINVGNAAAADANGLPAFIGQIRKPQLSGPAALAPFVGEFPVAYQYSGASVAYDMVRIGADGAITFLYQGSTVNSASAPTITADQVQEIKDWTGCCGNVQILTTRDFDNVDDSFRVYRDNAGATRSIEYYTKSGTGQADKIGVRLGTVTELPDYTLSVPASAGVTATVGGVDVSSSTISHQDSASNSFSIETLGATSPGITLQISLPVGTNLSLQTYSCQYTPTRTVRVGARAAAGASILSSIDGGRCAIRIDTITQTGVTGRFVAELVGNSQDRVPVVVQGAFRLGN